MGGQPKHSLQTLRLYINCMTNDANLIIVYQTYKYKFKAFLKELIETSLKCYWGLNSVLHKKHVQVPTPGSVGVNLVVNMTFEDLLVKICPN